MGGEAAGLRTGSEDTAVFSQVVDVQFAFGLLVHPVLSVLVTRLLG